MLEYAGLSVSVLLPSQPYQKRASAMSRRKFAAGTCSDHMALLRAFQVCHTFLLDVNRESLLHDRSDFYIESNIPATYYMQY